MNTTADICRKALAERAEIGLLRQPEVWAEVTPRYVIDSTGRRLLNFAGNDYLGLTQHPALRKGAARYALRFGTGAGASRAVNGYASWLQATEAKAAAFFGTQRGIIGGGGYQSCMSAVAAVALLKGCRLYFDKASHASLYAGAGETFLRRFAHNDMVALHRLLDRECPKIGAIITEGVFSMNGDRGDVAAVTAAAADYGLLSIVDDAHGAGMLGPGGRGSACDTPPDLLLATFSKAFGAYGGFIGCNDELYNYLHNYGGGLIYSTALPPAVCGAIDAALDIMPQLDEERSRVFEHAAVLRAACGGRGDSQIVPMFCADLQQAQDYDKKLRQAGFLTGMIRPPSVRQPMLRICPNAAHTDADVQMLGDVLAAIRAASP